MDSKKLGILTKFFLFCSGTSIELISVCPSYEKIKYSTIGFTIFLTSILAMISSFYAFSLIFEQLIIIIIGSIFWCLVIFNLDRYIVMTLRPTDSKMNNFIISLPRFVIALLVAVVISKPIEIKLFEKEIKNYEQNTKLKNIETVNNNFNNKILELDLKKSNVIENFEKKKLNVNEFYNQYMCECAGTCGTMIRGRGIECEARKNRWEKELIILSNQEKIKDSIIKSLMNSELEIREELNNKKTILQRSSFGFFDKVRALNSIDTVASNLILLIFIMIEIAPMLTKLLSAKGPYDNLILKSELEFETDFLKSADLLKIVRSKNEKIEKIQSDLDVKKTKEFMKKISRHDAYDRYEKLRNSIDE